MAPYMHEPHSWAYPFCILIVSALTACSDGEPDFYPLDKGRWWYFQTETTILDEHRTQRFIVANLGTGEHDDESVFIQRQASGREVYFKRTRRGIERVGVRAKIRAPTQEQSSVLIVPADLARNGRWKVQTHLTLIESRTFARQDQLRQRTLPVELSMAVAATNVSVRVPAGIFEHCLRIDGMGVRFVPTDRGNASAEVLVTHREWYAPEIGLVKSTRSEKSDSPFLKAGYYTQELLQLGR